jgi:hypothetical protein
MQALMDGLEVEELSGGCNGTFALPRLSRHVVHTNADGAFLGHINFDNVLMLDTGASKIEFIRSKTKEN